MIKKNCLLLFLVLLIKLNGYSQNSTDIIAIDVRKSGGKIEMIPGSEVKITDRKGYDNQPSFINDKQLAFSSGDEKGNFDIIIYNFENNKFTNLTKTPNQNEYSPRITDCGLYVSAVTVEESGKQRLWLYPTNFGEPELLYDDILPVGYYDWYDNRAAMFVLGDPNSLVYPYSKDDILTISQNIGRTVRKRPKSSEISYIDKNNRSRETETESFNINGFDLEKKVKVTYGNTLEKKEDFIWIDKNYLLTSRGKEIFVRKSSDTSWKKIGEVKLDGYGDISRLDYSPKLKKIVVVMDRID
ncbi:TolB family protein [Belliella marina]|uniref:TolB family protein n=1 Tax=Belliella marina TaxID=1644146 RepID=A0ABW4VSL2_9BACT